MSNTWNGPVRPSAMKASKPGFSAPKVGKKPMPKAKKVR